MSLKHNLILKNQNIAQHIKTQICLLLLQRYVKVRIVKNIHIIICKENLEEYIALTTKQMKCALLEIIAYTIIVKIWQNIILKI